MNAGITRDEPVHPMEKTLFARDHSSASVTLNEKGKL